MYRKLLALMMLVVLAGSVAVPGVLAQSEMELPVYDVTITEEGLEVPDGIAPGIAAFNFDNSAQEDTEAAVMLFQIADGVTMDDFFAGLQQAMTDQSSNVMDELGAIMGGSWMAPGSTTELIYDLTAGQYVLMDFNRETPAISPFEVSSDMEPVADSVDADVTVEMVDYSYVLPDEIDSGDQIWELTNTGDEEHEMSVMRILDDSLTESDIKDMLDNNVEPTEDQGYPVASFISLQPGATAWINLDLDPGRYLLLCFISAEDGEPHFDKGMLRLVTVK